MALRDRMAALKLIDRIKQHEMETIGADLAERRATEKDLSDQSAKLHEDAVREAADSTEDTRIFLPAYLNSVKLRQEDLAERQAAAAEKTAAIEEELFKAFREAKTTEQVLQRVKTEVAIEEARATASQMDDAGRALFMLARSGNLSQ
ncbi:MAG: flagellar motor protein [Sulfitobacter geojensis]